MLAPDLVSMGVSAFWSLILLESVLVLGAPMQFSPADSVHAFYYLWYGEPTVDGAYKHWDHEILPHWNTAERGRFEYGTRFTPPGNVHSPYYPARGPYSSRNTTVIIEHAQELLNANVNVIAVSWWGPSWRSDTHDTQGVNTDEVLGTILQEIEEGGGRMKMALHMEPYPGRTVETMREDLQHLVSRYGNSSCLLRIEGKPVYYVYDSYHIPASDWASLLSPNGSRTVRGTALDGVFLGLWVDQNDGDKNIAPGNFDGFYTYFASEAVSYGSQPHNWGNLASWAAQHEKIFVASIGPGYDDSRIRPWNAGATREREDGERYKRYWQQAMGSRAGAVSITSYNEWGEGTQIEPAKPWVDPASGNAFKDYGPGGPQVYMHLTRQFSDKFKTQLVQQQEEQQQGIEEGMHGSTEQPPGSASEGQHQEL